MSFNTFVRELNKGIEGHVVAYDNGAKQRGCILYLKKRPCTIFVPTRVIDGAWREAISVLRAKILAFDSREPHLSLIDNEGTLEFHAEAAPVPESVRPQAQQHKP